MVKILYSINDSISAASPDLLGGKGHGLYLMKKAGLPVPPAFIITTEACKEYMLDPVVTMDRVRYHIVPTVMKAFRDEFGYMPLVAIRSGAKDSMPGMMDTILNVGLHRDVNMEDWDSRLGSSCTEDSLCRLVEMYGSVVNGIDRKRFDGKSLEERLLLYKLEVGVDFPLPIEQFVNAIEAVFKSWNNDRAKSYRRMNGIADDLGTAVVIQAMVFGNMNDQSGTGVAFSRNYSTGENEVAGDWLVNGQGEDVVSGLRNTEPLSVMETDVPVAATQLLALLDKLEGMWNDMVDVEFTVQNGTLYMLQCRVGKRTAQAALRIAVEMAETTLISLEMAIERVTLKQFLAATRPAIPTEWIKNNAAHGVGIPASNGCATGVAVFSSKAAIDCKEPCILISEETTPDDIEGMNAALGIFTSTGGATSHAAVVARGMDKVCVVGCLRLEKKGFTWVLTSEDKKVKRTIKEGVTKVTLDGATGMIWIDERVPFEGGVDSDLTSRFFQMLEAKYGFYRTCVKAEEMIGAEKVLLATYMLDREHSGAYLDAAMQDLCNAIGGREAVIDLRTINQVCREADEPLEFMWGALNKDAESIDMKIAAMLQVQKNLPITIKVLALGLEKDQIDVLVENKIMVVEEVSTLPGLLKANGLCVADFDKLLKVMSREDVARIVDLKKAAGESIQSFNIMDRVEPDNLGRNAMFAISGMQAVQSLLKGS